MASFFFVALAELIKEEMTASLFVSARKRDVPFQYLMPLYK